MYSLQDKLDTKSISQEMRYPFPWGNKGLIYDVMGNSDEWANMLLSYEKEILKQHNSLRIDQLIPVTGKGHNWVNMFIS